MSLMEMGQGPLDLVLGATKGLVLFLLNTLTQSSLKCSRCKIVEGGITQQKLHTLTIYHGFHFLNIFPDAMVVFSTDLYIG